MKTSEAFPSNYLKAADLNGRSVRVVIDSVTVEKIGDDRKPVLHFVGKEKTLVLNKTNSNRIEEATNTDEMDDWAGWTITLYACKVDFQGKRVDAIRVDDRPGTSQPPRPAGRAAAQRAEVPVEHDAPPPITDDDIPFAWLLPLALPLAGLLGAGAMLV
jgi:hypothetical protein